MLSNDEQFLFRESLFTPWMTAEVLQEHTETVNRLGMIPIYSEHQPELGFREIYWTPNIQTYFEVRSARTFDEFQKIADRNLGSGHRLSTLQISSDDRYSSVWLDENGLLAASGVLSSLGITPALIRS